MIVGAGFGGLDAGRGSWPSAPVEVTLVDRNNFHTFQPLLYQVATAGLNAGRRRLPRSGAIFRRQPNVDFRQGTVTGVDWDATRSCWTRADGDELPFDHLVLAAGPVANYLRRRGRRRARLPALLARRRRPPAQPRARPVRGGRRRPALVDDGALTFVVVGGGPTGVEMAGALVELFEVVLRRDFPRLDVDGARVVLLEMAPSCSRQFSPLRQRHALETLRSGASRCEHGRPLVSMTPTRSSSTTAR